MFQVLEINEASSKAATKTEFSKVAAILIHRTWLT